MEHYLLDCSRIALWAPFVAALIVAFSRSWGRVWAQSVTITGVACSCLASWILFFKGGFIDPAIVHQDLWYTWAELNQTVWHVGAYLDQLSVIMMMVVTSISLVVHVYTIGYMHEDPGAARFFSTISFFTGAMLILVVSPNFLQLFFGWEAVGLVSYLLIGFWFGKESAVFASLKAFIVNRLGDLGFIVGIAAIWMAFGSLDYQEVFAHLVQDASSTNTVLPLGLITIATVGLLIGALSKSAQIPLHIWLPDSMEGPTPISALIHAATMVTAGIFMIIRCAPLYEQVPMVLHAILIIGASTGFFMGLVGFVQNDIKRIIAYSTISQLGYMVAALGISAYPLALFHLITHACFKALLFLGAGSVIHALHNEQDIRCMGGLRHYLPGTHLCMWVGSLALMGLPLFAGFYSKDAILMALEHAQAQGYWGAQYAFVCLTLGVFVTAFYSFRLLFRVFYGRSLLPAGAHLHEPWVILGPLCVLVIPSVGLSWFIAPVFLPGVDLMHMTLHALWSLPFFLIILAGVIAWFIYLYAPGVWQRCAPCFAGPVWILERKYGLDLLHQRIITPGSLWLFRQLSCLVEGQIIDRGIVGHLVLFVKRLGCSLSESYHGQLTQSVAIMVVSWVLLLLLLWGFL